MKNLQKIIIAFALALTVLLPQLALAATNSTTGINTDTCEDLKKRFTNAGGANIVAPLPKYCTVGSLYTKFINYALYIVGIVATLAVIYGGYVYMTAAGNAEQVKRGRSILTWAIVGLIVVLAAAVIVNVVVKFLVEK